MKVTCVAGLLLAFATVAHAETATTASAACGRAETNFNVHFPKGAASLRTQANSSDHATLYMIEQYIPYDKGHAGQPVVRQGVDGHWIGATQGLSYIETAISPGEHHLCAQVQSRNKKLASLVSLNRFTAQANQSYFFLAQLHSDSSPMTLELVNDDEGKRLLSEAARSESTPK